MRAPFLSFVKSLVKNILGVGNESFPYFYFL